MPFNCIEVIFTYTLARSVVLNVFHLQPTTTIDADTDLTTVASSLHDYWAGEVDDLLMQANTFDSTSARWVSSSAIGQAFVYTDPTEGVGSTVTEEPLADRCNVVVGLKSNTANRYSTGRKYIPLTRGARASGNVAELTGPNRAAIEEMFGGIKNYGVGGDLKPCVLSRTQNQTYLVQNVVIYPNLGFHGLRRPGKGM